MSFIPTRSNGRDQEASKERKEKDEKWRQHSLLSKNMMQKHLNKA